MQLNAEQLGLQQDFHSYRTLLETAAAVYDKVHHPQRSIQHLSLSMGEVDQPLSEEIDSPTHLTDRIDTATEYFLHQTKCKTFCPTGKNPNTYRFNSHTP